jgi:hypothetical protein
MSHPEMQSFVIVGMTRNGEKFRPSDWADRLCGVLSVFRATKKMLYSPYVSPGNYNGQNAVFVDGHLQELDPQVYQFVLDFARDNNLQIIDGVCPINPSS